MSQATFTDMAVYFASDFHLGIDALHSSAERERRIVAWLEGCRQDAEAIYLVGDLFEFWFEWKRVVPRGYVRFLGKLAELVDAGIPIHVFTGNHDMWLFDYLEKEIGVQIHRERIWIEHQGKRILVGHGDGLGPNDYGYKRLKRLFRFKPARWLLTRFHPNFTIWIASFWSNFSRNHQPEEKQFLGADKEWLVAYSERKLAQDPRIDYFIFGHRHLPIEYLLSNEKSIYFNLGEWLNYYTYVRLANGIAELKTYQTHEK